ILWKQLVEDPASTGITGLYASGRIDREAADAAFPARRAEVEREPEDWRAWFRLALAYDAAGDRKRARRAMRDAVALDRGRPAHHLADGEG
ncbi:hypothetical protein SA11R_08410, partial [Rothia kristinae]